MAGGSPPQVDVRRQPSLSSAFSCCATTTPASWRGALAPDDRAAVVAAFMRECTILSRANLDFVKYINTHTHTQTHTSYNNIHVSYMHT
eukprot:COSAG01_NODE_3523_length_5972_cov_2.681307_8_plen_89_part_00